MESINNARYLPHLVDIRYKAVTLYRKNGNSLYVCRKYHISRKSLYRWNKRFDGTKESLKDKSHKPHSRHPKAHTDEEINNIKKVIKRNPKLTLNEIWYKLKFNYGYTRQLPSLYRVLRRLNFYHKSKIKNTSKRHNGKYPELKNVGLKWQIDVKYVPKECKSKNLPKDMKFYQYTCIDEASRERYLYWYQEHTPTNTVDFIKRCIRYYNYKPETIQTDNRNRIYL